MRYVYFILLAVLISSCAHGNLRLRKVDNEDRIEIAESKNPKERTSKQSQIIIESSSQEETAELAVKHGENSENETIAVIDGTELTSNKFNEIVSDEIDDGPSKKQKVRQALVAERDARKAKNSFIWSLSMMATIIIPFLGIISLFSIVPFIIGSIRLRQSNKSDYITLEGERDARSAGIMQLIYGVLLSLAVIGISIILVILLL